MQTLLAHHPRPWRYIPDHLLAPFGDVVDADAGPFTLDTATVARLMTEADALELIEYANAGQE